MKLKLTIDYYTHYGQKIYVCGSTPIMGQWDENKALEMLYVSSSLWSVDIDLFSEGKVEYYFLVKQNNSVMSRESGERHFLLIRSNHDYFVQNLWLNSPTQKYLYTSGFKNSFCAHKINNSTIYYRRTHLLKVVSPFIERNQILILSGSSDMLGDWHPEKALHMQYEGNCTWQIGIDSDHLKNMEEYKLAVYDTIRNEVVHWEDGSNRILLPLLPDGVQVQELTYRREWVDWKGAGVAIPIFSLRTNQSSGIGEFSDLKKMVDWAALTGQKIIQVLPINDTTISYSWTDSYPYNAISIYALHPIYLGIREFPLKNKILNDIFNQQADELNNLESLDYEKVLAFKGEYLRELFREQKNDLPHDEAYEHFLENNENWLFPYACFSFLRDRYNTTDATHWGEYAIYDKDKLQNLLSFDKEASDNQQLLYFVQYLLDKQLREAKEYAHSHGVILKGDVPIGISRHSVEAWIEPHLFNLDVQTGAPPDDFSVNGQNWGFPTYNWDEMAKDNYRWWVNRFQKMSDYFDAYRIDHILGFFRIWEIPQSSIEGLLGYFSPSLPLTVDEIRSSGLQFDEHQMLVANVRGECLDAFFGDLKNEALDNYIFTDDGEHFYLKEFCDTQSKVRGLFWNKTDGRSLRMQDALFALCNEVLFVRDKCQPEKYHPRIAAQSTFQYRQLSSDSQNVFNLLYDDYFYYRHTHFWQGEALRKLPVLINATSMLVCGEDLGMIPQSVPYVMDYLQILSLEIERMPKEYNTRFSNLNMLPYLSVCTTSTHDMSPIRSWWTENKESTQYYYNHLLGREGEAPNDCNAFICQQIVSNHLNSTSMFVILPIQDWLSIESGLRKVVHEGERINIPSVPHHYWNYRMHIPIEKLIESTRFNQKIKQMIEESNR